MAKNAWLATMSVFSSMKTICSFVGVGYKHLILQMNANIVNTGLNVKIWTVLWSMDKIKNTNKNKINAIFLQCVNAISVQNIALRTWISFENFGFECKLLLIKHSNMVKIFYKLSIFWTLFADYWIFKKVFDENSQFCSKCRFLADILMLSASFQPNCSPYSAICVSSYQPFFYTKLIFQGVIHF